MAPVKLIIFTDDNGIVHVTGPLHDKNLCNALLEEAKSIVKNFGNKSIVIPTAGILKEELNKINGSDST